jgi:hypothetical protein
MWTRLVRNLHSNAVEEGLNLFEDNLQAKTTPDRNDVLESRRFVLDLSDKLSDDDNSNDIGHLDQSDFLPADFHDDDDDDDLLDLDATRPGLGPSFPSGPFTGTMGPPGSAVPLGEQKARKESEDNNPLWNSVGQLVKFREASTAIADDYLKSQGIKVRARRKRSTFTILNKAGEKMYQEGQEDAKRINVRIASNMRINIRRKRIKDAEEE